MLPQRLDPLRADLPAQIRPRDVRVAVARLRFDGQQPQFFDEGGVHVREDRILRSGVIRAQRQHGLGLQTGAGLADADAGGGALLHALQRLGVQRVFQQAVVAYDVLRIRGSFLSRRAVRQNDSAVRRQLPYDFFCDEGDEFFVEHVSSSPPRNCCAS